MSGNSSTPPSADDLPGRTPPPQRRRRDEGKRRQGGQLGAPGSHLAWSQDPGETVPLFPLGACACGRDLAAASDLGAAASHQVVDVPLVTASVTQYDGHAVQCACGRLHQAAAPPQAGAPGTVSYGLNIQAWCVFLLVAHHVPVARCAEIVASLSGTRPSDGFVHAMPARAAKAVAAANMLIRALIITASVICAGETPIRVGPGPKTRKKYLLVHARTCSPATSWVTSCAASIFSAILKTPPGACSCRKSFRAAHATCWYSCSSPPSRSRLRMSRHAIWSGTASGAGSGWGGRVFAMP